MRKFGLLSRALPKLQQKIVPLDFASFFNHVARGRQPSALREQMKSLGSFSKDMVAIGEGLPHPRTIPITHMLFITADGKLTYLHGQELVDALTYQPTQGYPPLIKKMQEFIMEFHAPPRWEDRDVIATVGAQDGLSKVMEMSLERGDAIVVANPTYSGLLSCVRPFQPNLISASFGPKGLDTKEMRDKLTALWSSRSSQIKLPKLMYLTPTANNPSGHIMTDEQKREVYDIACEFNLLIIEDDPYYFLSFQDELPRSLLSMDTENRVIRLDTFSKLFGGGLRAGVMTGPKDVVRSIEMHMQTSVLHTSSLSQVIVLKLLEQMGYEGFLKHAKGIADFYRDRRDQMCALAEKYVGDLAEWEVPAGGMFLWMKVKGVEDVKSMVLERGLKKNVSLVPGHAFMADPSKPCPYIRLSFSLVPMSDVEKAMQRLAELIKEEQRRPC